MDKSDQKHKPVASVTILQHIGCETPGIISDCLQLAGIDMRLVRIFDENPVPSNLNGRAGLIVMGGPMSVYEHERFPFLLEEQRLIEEALNNNKPVLGICLGYRALRSKYDPLERPAASGKLFGGFQTAQVLGNAPGSLKLEIGLEPRGILF